VAQIVIGCCSGMMVINVAWWLYLVILKAGTETTGTFVNVVINHHQNNCLLCFIRWVMLLHVSTTRWSSLGH